MFNSNSRKLILLIAILSLLIAGLNMRFVDTPTANIDGVIHNIDSISPEAESWDDLDFLAKELEGKRIVVIGEALHSDGSTIIAKSRLVKYLHDELGFDLLAFETGLYDAWLLNRDSVLNPANSIFKFWAVSDQVESLWEFVRLNRIEVAGFDIQPTGELSDSIRRDMLFDYMRQFAPKADSVWGNYYQRSVSFYRMIPAMHNETVRCAIFSELDSMINLLKSQEPNSDIDIHISYLSGIKHWMDYSRKYRSGDRVRMAIRDSLMAERIIQLADKPQNRDRKIILWMANIHAFKDNHQFIGSDFKNTGEVINKHFGNDLYTIIFSSYCREHDGQTYDFAGNGSLEHSLHTLKKRYLYVSNLSKNRIVSLVNQGISFPIALQKVADGLFFIDTMQNISYENIRNNKLD